MKVKTRIVLLVIFFFISAVVGVIGTRASEGERLRVLLEDRQNQISLFVHRALDQDTQQLEHLLVDYSAALARLTNPADAPVRLNAVQVVADQKTAVAVWLLNAAQERIGFSSHPSQALLRDQLSFPEELLSLLARRDGVLCYFDISTSAEVAQICAMALRAQGAAAGAPLNGYLFVGRRWDAQTLTSLSNLLDYDLMLTAARSVPAPQAAPSAAHEMIVAYPLPGWDGSPLDTVLQVRTSQPVAAAVLGMRDRSVLIYASLVALFLVAGGLALYLWVYVPLSKISTSLERDGDEALQSLMDSPTEFGNMARLIRRSFEYQVEIRSETQRREQAERAFQREQEYGLAILNMVYSIVVVMDPDGHIIRCNPACERTLGLSFDQIQGRLFWEIFTPVEGVEVGKETFLRITRERVILNQEDRFCFPHGKIIWIAWSNGFINDDQGHVLYIVGTGVETTERKLRERHQMVLASLGSELREMLTSAQTIQVISEYVSHFMQYEVVAIVNLSRKRGRLAILGAAGKLAEAVTGWEISQNDGVVAQALASHKPYINNALTEADALLCPGLRGKVKALAWVPLVAEDNSIGLLFCAGKMAITEADHQLLAAVADMAAGALQRSLLTEETQRRLQRLMALHTINIAINASLDVPVTLQLLVSQITLQLGVDAADILLVEPLTHDLTFAGGYGFRSNEVAKSHFWRGEGKAGQVARYRQSVFLYEPEGIGGEFPQAPWMQAENFVAYEGVPLLDKGEVRGVLETFHRAPYVPDSEWVNFLESLAIQASIAINNADLLDRLKRSNQELEMAYDATIQGWAQALELRDLETIGHTQRVVEWTVRLAQGMGVAGGELVHIRRGALLHDIGKMGIPDSVLLKPTSLNDEEWKVMRQHPSMALEMLSPIAFLRPALAIPFCHHERWNGSGYPQGLAGAQIPLAARIFAVVDVWDALFNQRRYRDGWPEDKVLEYLRAESGRLFDSQVVDAFLEMRVVMDRRPEVKT